MIIGYQYGKIKFYVEQKPEHLEFYPDVEWLETDEEYIMIGDEYVLKGSSKAIEEAEREVRELRDSLITSVDWRLDRYTEQKQLGVETTDSEETIKSILEYKQYLRNLPDEIGFPDVEVMTFDEFIKGI